MWEGPAHCGWYHPWAGGPGVYKKAGWASHGEQASKQHPSMGSASAPDWDNYLSELVWAGNYHEKSSNKYGTSCEHMISYILVKYVSQRPGAGWIDNLWYAHLMEYDSEVKKDELPWLITKRVHSTWFYLYTELE